LNGFHKSFVHLQSLGFLAPASDGFSRSAEDWAKLTKPRAIAAVAVEGEQTLAAVSTQIVRPLAKGKKPYPTDPALLCNMCGRKRHGPDGCFFKAHPDRNQNSSESFAMSAKGKAYKDMFSIAYLMPDRMVTASSADIAAFLVGNRALSGALRKTQQVLLVNSLSQNHSLPKTNAVLTVAQVSVEGTIEFDSHAQGTLSQSG
jgi:hypothetical protein